jgi:hypothetical protein
VRPEQLKKQPTSPIPNFSTLLLAGAVSGQAGSFIGDKIKLPTILTAFRSEYRSKKGWGVELSTNGACEEFIIPLIENKKSMENKTLPIEVYYALGARLEQFLKVIFKDATICAKHHPYILYLISKDILGLSLDERSISIEKPIIFDENLSLDVNQTPQFKPPSLEETIQRCESEAVQLDPNAHILDTILLHIYRTIDPSVVEHILSPEVFNLPAKIEQRVQQITHAPAQSPLWIQMAEDYPDWESISRTSPEVRKFISGALKKEDLYQTVRGLWGLDNTNTPITKHLPEETFNDLKQQRLEGRYADMEYEEARYIDDVLQEERRTGKETPDEYQERKYKEAALKQQRRENQRSGSKKPIIQTKTKTTTIRQDEPGLLNYFEETLDSDAEGSSDDDFDNQLEKPAKEAKKEMEREKLYSFFDAILDLQFQDFGGEDPELPGQRFFNEPKFWTGVVRDTIGAISTEKNIPAFEYNGKNLWNTWHYNISGEVLEKSPLQRFIYGAAKSLVNQPNTSRRTPEFTVEILLLTNIPLIYKKNPHLTEDILDYLTDETPSQKLSQKAIKHFKPQFQNILAGDLKELVAKQKHVDNRQAKKVGDIILVGTRGNKDHRIPSRLIAKKLSSLFKVIPIIMPDNIDGPFKKPYYNTVYASAKDVADGIFSVQGCFTDEEKTKKAELANHFHALSINSSESESALQKIVPIDWSSEEWTKWLARLLYGYLQHYFSMGASESSIAISHQKYNFPKDSGGKLVVKHLKQYFEQHFSKTTPSIFFEIYFSMVNCGQYTPRTDKPIRMYGTSGHLTGIDSHFNISKRTAYFIGAMTNFLDALDTKPDGYLRARNTTPLSRHDAYTKASIDGITPDKIERIRADPRPSKQVAAEMGLEEKAVIEIRKTINFVPFYLDDTKKRHGQEAKRMKNKYSDIGQPRMSAFDIAHPPYGEDNRAKWIIANLDGLAKAYDSQYGKNQKRILKHICLASGNDFKTKRKIIPPSSLKISIGRTLTIDLLNTQIEKKGRDPRFDHILDWRILYECSKIGTPEEEKTFDQFFATLQSEIVQINGETIQFSQLLHIDQLADYFRLLSDPMDYLFHAPKTKKFNFDEFDPLPSGLKADNLYFLAQLRGGIDSDTQKRYTLQIARGFISYLMSKAGYNIDGGWNEKFAPEDRTFKRK